MNPQLEERFMGVLRSERWRLFPPATNGEMRRIALDMVAVATTWNNDGMLPKIIEKRIRFYKLRSKLAKYARKIWATMSPPAP